MQHWQSTHKWLHDSDFELLRRLLVRLDVRVHLIQDVLHGRELVGEVAVDPVLLVLRVLDLDDELVDVRRQLHVVAAATTTAGE